MSIRANLTVVALLTGFALASSPVKADVLGFNVALPEIGAVTAEVGKAIAADMTAYLRNAMSAPRVSHKRQSPTVTVEEMETVVVVATRLPAIEALAQSAAK